MFVMENVNIVCKHDVFMADSREIAENFGKEHKNVKRDIEKLISSNLSVSKMFVLSEYKDSMNRTQTMYYMNRDGFSLLVMGFTGGRALDWKLKYIEAFNKMEQALQDLKFKVGNKKHQLNCMALLQDLLPDYMKQDKVNYIKANTVVDKAVSNYFGFPKMIKKIEMNKDMLEVRENVLNDYLKLFEVLQDNHEVKEVLYKKYAQPKLIEGDV